MQWPNIETTRETGTGSPIQDIYIDIYNIVYVCKKNAKFLYACFQSIVDLRDFD